MDINMPEGMDGVQTTSKIRKIFDPYTESRGQQYFVVAHTALPEDQFGDFREKGFDGFMQKPLSLELLKTYLRQVKLIKGADSMP